MFKSHLISLIKLIIYCREAFTMDANLSRAVTEAFVRFHEDGLLYRYLPHILIVSKSLIREIIPEIRD